MTPSHSVVQEENVDRTRLLVEQGADATVQDADSDEAILLHSSVQGGRTHPAHLPIGESEDMTAPNKPEPTPLLLLTHSIYHTKTAHFLFEMLVFIWTRQTILFFPKDHVCIPTPGCSVRTYRGDGESIAVAPKGMKGW